MSLRDRMKKNKEKVKKRRTAEDSIMDRMNTDKRFMKPDQETFDEFFAVADSLWKQQHIFKEGEPWSRNEEIMMFDVDTGDYTDEYKAQFDKFDSLSMGNTPRGFHYEDLISDASKKNIGKMELMDIQMNPLFKAVEGYFKDGPLYHKDTGEPSSPYDLYNKLNKMVEEEVPGDRNDRFRNFDISDKEKEYIQYHLPNIIPNVFTGEKPDTSKKK